jgi:hypothetical protein
MVELRVLALAGLIVTVIVSSLAAIGIAMLAQRIQRAWHSGRERRVGSGPVGWRLRF